MAQDSPLSIRRAETDDDCRNIFTFLVKHMLREVAKAQVDPDKAFIELYRVVNQEHAWIVEDEDGEIVASCGLILAQDGLWYGVTEQFWTERWLFVRKDYRPGGEAFRMLRDEIKALAADSGLPAIAFRAQRLTT